VIHCLYGDDTDSGGGQDKDGSPVRKIMAARQGISGPTRRLLAYIIKHGPISPDDEIKFLAGLGDDWQHVERKDLRRYRAAG